MRVINFNAGPAALPETALSQAAAEMLDFEGTGMSIMEHSHRDQPYEKVHREAISLMRSLLSIPEDYDVLFMSGGARTQFALVPMNFLKPESVADYVVTGTWAKGAYDEAKFLGKPQLAASTEAEQFTRVPKEVELKLDPKAAYLHITSNNTLYGTAWGKYPTPPAGVNLVADMTSDLLGKKIDVSKFSLIYASAQKNVGPAGVTVVIVKKSWIKEARTDIPSAFRYASYSENESLWNTPPTFPIYMVRNTLKAYQAWGGLEWIERENRKKAALLYDTVDADPDFFRCPVEKDSRSIMNVVFRLPSEDLEKQFMKEATASGLVGLKGHRSVGGMRASIYNAMTVAQVETLANFMKRFRKAV